MTLFNKYFRLITGCQTRSERDTLALTSLRFWLLAPLKSTFVIHWNSAISSPSRLREGMGQPPFNFLPAASIVTSAASPIGDAIGVALRGRHSAFVPFRPPTGGSRQISQICTVFHTFSCLRPT